MQIREILIGDIKPARYNPRVDLKPGQPEYEKIKRSITEFGFVEPLVWNQHNGVLVGGHQRLKVLQELGYERVHVSIVDIQDEKKEKALNIALNKVQGDWDEVKLAEILQGMKNDDFDITLSGFTEMELDDILERQGKMFEPTNEEEQPRLDQFKMAKCPECGHEFKA